MNFLSTLTIFMCLISSALFADTKIGMDLVSRYVWRGTDYGNAAAIQPFIEKKVGKIKVGAWGSWSISPGLYYVEGYEEMVSESSGNECDLYISTDFEPIVFTLTDYFFPAYNGSDSLMNVNRHTLELSAKGDVASVSIFAAINMFGDVEKSSYLEFVYKSFSLGLGNGSYSTNGKIVPVSIGLSAKRENFIVSYIINPDKQTSFLVFGASF